MTDLTYAYLPPEGEVTRHMWTLVGPKGAVHAWAQEHAEEFRRKWGEAYYGGIEMHSPKRLYDWGDGKPSHESCWLLKGPCWHDGSSLQFSEQIEPFLPREQPFEPHTHEYVYSLLHDRYQAWFKAEEVE